MGSVSVIITFAALTIALLVYGVYLLAYRRRVAVAERVETYAAIEREAAQATEAEFAKGTGVSQLFNLLLGRGYTQRLEGQLAQADIPMKVSEYILLRLLICAIGVLIGWAYFGYVHSAVVLGIVGFVAPGLVVRFHQRRRRTKFVRQLADALLLLTNSLRAGYSFVKGLEMVAKEAGDPLGKEMSRVLREVSLGATIDEALVSLANRMHSQDLDIVVSAFLVQKDVGGNLTEIMEKVAETIRDRLRLQGDVRVLTTQGRLSGLIIGLLPFAVFTVIFLKSPEYFKVMIADPRINLLGGLDVPLGLLLMLGAVIWQLIGALIIYRIVSVKI